ncbi:HelD family protein [Streptomyces antimicrobicus]|uniref:AAA family ATPase n=1 Tax=Streptomyces antimicrobicus TaxID=2883108 RepID=A0ABS8B7T6_9ACTN|nr:AAA family ATPase [Streptomyces antimicrobicus]MCB5180662.1 AAA family ATPase [Streptomyces antimicrobicus]
MSAVPATRSEEAELGSEQAFLDLLHAQVDARTAELSRQLAATLAAGGGGTAQARLERQADAERLAGQLTALRAAEQQLCFGRLDLDDGERRYVGRIGVRGPRPEDDPLLIDWRAPAARPFYTATPAARQSVARRRHLHVRERTVVRVDDELLDADAAGAADTGLTGEAALMSALRAERTGRMRDIVATLQAEQDRIIRAPHTGVLVVQGGPGTGKTVVALHRAAYLLYTAPRLNDRGVLVVGPNTVFRGYISQVLPGLGETSVLHRAVAELYPGVTATGAESDAAAEVKGRAVMAQVLAAAVRAHQAEAAAPVRVRLGGEDLTLDHHWLRETADAARRTLLPHNLARPVFCRAVIGEVARRLARVIADIEDRFEDDLSDRIDAAQLDRAVARDLAAVFGADAPPVDLALQGRQELADAQEHWLAVLPGDPGMRRLLDRLWPVLTPQSLLTELYADPAALAAAAPSLTPAERALLRRPPGGPWTTADVPLLDEAAELLGFDHGAALERSARERAEEVAYAQGVIDIARGSRAGEDEDGGEGARLTAADLVDAERLAAGYREADLSTVAERAAADRSWTFGHVIVDEAQELSAMAWRLLVRRCPSRSFTVVGDVAQTGEAAGSVSWRDALAPHFGDRWRLERLSVNYRTPVEIVGAAAGVLAAIHPEIEAARAVRASGEEPWRERVPAGELAARLAERVRQEAAAVGAGRLAVLVPATDLARLADVVRRAVPDASWGPEADLDRGTVVLTPRQAKGLEFDAVLLVEPGSVLESSARGLGDLYVALTRATRRLGVVHTGEIPAVLRGLAEKPE